MMENQIKENVGPSGECFISVDVETSGPIPGEFSLLSIGACIAQLPSDRAAAGAGFVTFYCTLKPIEGAGSDPEALAVTGFSLDDLAQTGKRPEEAMLGFEQWVAAAAGSAKPVFVGLNAPFDWSFINYYFHRFLGRNPFGFSALDIKSLYMGMMGGAWGDTKSSRMAEALGIEHGKLSHHALDDAQVQTELFIAICARSKR
jgi:DNA polymerase III epsilon subunit-like protein